MKIPTADVFLYELNIRQNKTYMPVNLLADCIYTEFMHKSMSNLISVNFDSINNIIKREGYSDFSLNGLCDYFKMLGYNVSTHSTEPRLEIWV